LWDVTTPLIGRDLTIECKSRKDGFREFYRWLEDRDLLVVKSDRHKPLVVVPWALAIQIATIAESHFSLLRQRQSAEPAAPLGRGNRRASAAIHKQQA
jgi:hypothetical protein